MRARCSPSDDRLPTGLAACVLVAAGLLAGLAACDTASTDGLANGEPGSGDAGTASPADASVSDPPVDIDAGESPVDAGLAACETLEADACAARDDCYGRYTGPNPCPCDSPGCCSEYIECVNGRPDCTPDTIACLLPVPLCEGPYTIGYVPGCFEGCVLATECP